MTPAEFMSAGFLALAAFGWWQAITARRDPQPSHVTEAWQHRRYLRPTGEPRMWRLP